MLSVFKLGFPDKNIRYNVDVSGYHLETFTIISVCSLLITKIILSAVLLQVCLSYDVIDILKLSVLRHYYMHFDKLVIIKLKTKT